MNKIKILLLLICCFLISPLKIIAAEVDSIKITEYGIFKRIIEKSKSTNDVSTGVLHKVRKIKLIQQTNKIPAKLGITFGVRFLINGTPKNEKVPVLIKWLHPRMVNPKTKKIIYSSSWTSQKTIGKVGYVGHSYKKKGDLPIGEYKVQIFYKDKIMANKTFNVYEP